MTRLLKKKEKSFSSIKHAIKKMFVFPTATSIPGGNRLLRKDPTGQIMTWKMRDELRKRLLKQVTINGTEKIGKFLLYSAELL